MSKDTAKFLFEFLPMQSKNNIVYKNYMKKYFMYHHGNISFLEEYIQEYKLLNKKDKDYVYKLGGLSATLTSKIIPLFYTYRHLWLQSSNEVINTMTVVNQFKRISDELRMCCTINLDMVERNHFDNHEKVLKRLYNINHKLIELITAIDKIRV